MKWTYKDAPGQRRAHDYTVLSGQDADELKHAVEDAFIRGYLPAGGVSRTEDGTFYQAVYLPVPYTTVCES